MIVLLLAVVAILGMVVAAAVLILITRVLAWIAQAIVMVACAALGASVVGITVAATGHDIWAAWLAVLSLPLLLWGEALWLRRSTKREIAAAREVPALLDSGAAEPADDAAVGAAWKALAAMIPPADRSVLFVARDACARLLYKQQGAPLDLEWMECAVLIRRSLPELAARTSAVWDNAGEGERQEVSAAILTDVARLGQRAAVLLDQHGRQARDALVALRTHIATRTQLS